MSRTILIGLDKAAPIPLHTAYNSGKFEGFEVDLMDWIRKELDLTLDYQIADWNDLMQQLETGRLDLICSAVTITEERYAHLEFSLPYLAFELCLVTRKEKQVDSLLELSGSTLGVRSGTEAEKYAKDNLPDTRLVTFDINDDLYDQVRNGEIDGLLDDAPIARALIRNEADLTVSMCLPDSASCYGIAMEKGNTTLKNEIDNAIQNLKKSGHYGSLLQKWFDGDPNMMPGSTGLVQMVF